MMNLWTLPSSSSHFHLIVPVIIFGACDPAKPLTIFFVGRNEIRDEIFYSVRHGGRAPVVDTYGFQIMLSYPIVEA
jgi:hypothetical protein